MNARDRGASSSITTRVCLSVASNHRVFFPPPLHFARTVARRVDDRIEEPQVTESEWDSGSEVRISIHVFRAAD